MSSGTDSVAMDEGSPGGDLTYQSRHNSGSLGVVPNVCYMAATASNSSNVDSSTFRPLQAEEAASTISG